MSVAVDADQAFLAAVERIADDVAAAHALEVDRDARFPRESIEALREARALGAFVPVAHGGESVSFPAIARACFLLGRRCAASGMVFAMHQIQVVTLVRHATPGSHAERHLADLAAQQRLVASVTSEVGTGGDMGRSVAAVEEDPDGDGPDARTFTKRAPTVSYGAHADDHLTTVRRAGDAQPGDQVLVLTHRDQVVLEPTGSWDPLGMRGTDSPGFTVTARFAAGQVLDAPYSVIGPESMVPVSHVLWTHLWLGIATDAFDRARAFVRAAAKAKPGEDLPAAGRLARLHAELGLLRAEVATGLRDFLEASEGDRASLSTMRSILRFNELKVTVSEHAPQICQDAMGVCGIMGFKNDSPFSIGRHLRDAMSGALMVANERLHATNASLLLIAKDV